MPDIARIQAEVKAAGADGWLLYDFHNRDAIAYHVLGMDYGKFTSRRWFYWIPAAGEPIRLCHKVESKKLESLPGEKRLYLSWQRAPREPEGDARPGAKKIAMQYSPMANIPYVSLVDGGTIDLIRSLGFEVVSSAGLVQTFQAVLDEAGYQSHLEAGERVQRIKDQAFALIGTELKAGRTLTQYDVQQFIVQAVRGGGPHLQGRVPDRRHQRAAGRPALRADARQRAADQAGRHGPHRPLGEAGPAGRHLLRHHLVRLRRPGAARQVRRDLPRRPRRARRGAGVHPQRYAAGKTLYGWEVDDACRAVVEKAGYGPYFLHRTGHSIGEEVHGNGVNIDNLETKDERELVPGICFSIEPGIYLAGEMAVRSEIDVFITPSGKVDVAGAMQRELVLI